MTAYPSVSVVMPAYNNAAHIRLAIESVLNQTVMPMEIIVVDDGSTDESRDLARQFGDKVKVIAQENAGSAVARNRGIEASQGEYIAFLDADDYWHREKLELQLAAARDIGAKMIYSSFVPWEADSNSEHEPPEPLLVRSGANSDERSGVESAWLYPTLLDDCVVWTSTVLVERELLKTSGGFDPRLRKGQDLDLWLRLSRLGPWTKVARVLALYRINSGSITHQVREINYEYEILSGALARWGLDSPDGSRADGERMQRKLGRSCVTFGLMHLKAGDPRIALDAFKKALAHNGMTPRGLLLCARALVKIRTR